MDTAGSDIYKKIERKWLKRGGISLSEAYEVYLVHLAYPIFPTDLSEHLSPEMFAEGLKECKTQQVLHISHTKMLML